MSLFGRLSSLCQRLGLGRVESLVEMRWQRRCRGNRKASVRCLVVCMDRMEKGG